MSAFRTGLIAALIMAAVMLIVETLGVMLMLASWASSAVLIAGFRTSTGARPWPVGAGHVLGGVTGYAIYLSAKAFAIDPWMVAPVAVGLAASAMVATRSYHPPAVANAVIPLIAPVDPTSFAMGIAAGAAALAAFAFALDRIDAGETHA